ncbi:glycosyltransferase [bacterium]|nr:glycosyltransferase [bacterium]MCP5462249.1 glycosyltransferase [bacterium]
MKISDCFVSVVVPLEKNASLYLKEFVQEVIDILKTNYANYELILVDDHLTESIAASLNPLLQQLKCIRLIRLSRHFGIEIAITAGLDTSIGDYVVVVEPNSDPPAEIPQIVNLARANNGVVIGIAERRTKRSSFVKIFEPFFYKLCTFSGIHFPRNATFFQALSRQAVNGITRVRQKGRYFRVLALNVGFNPVLYHYNQINRSGIHQKMSGIDSLRLALAMIISNSMAPLRFVGLLGIIGSILTMVYILYIIVINILKKDVVEGWTTMSFQITGLFFIHFLILSVICEYVGQILEESKQRPLYYVMEEKSSSVLIADETRRNVMDRSTSSSTGNKETPL